MKIIYRGKFSGDIDSLPNDGMRDGAVKFREFDDPKKLSIFANGIAIVLMIALAALYFVRAGRVRVDPFGCAASLLTLFPHELLHAVCFKKEAYIYTNFKQGMLFVVGGESMTRARFVFMSLLPNIVFGFIPYAIGMIYPDLTFFAMLGTLCLSMGAGDFYNVFNALTQMPKGSRTFLYKFNSYWYMPTGEES